MSVDFQSMAQCHLVFPQSDGFRFHHEAYQPFEKPLPRGHGSVESERDRAVTARERSFNQETTQFRIQVK